MRWSLFVQLAAEFTYVVLFVRALLTYLRRRDPLQRDVALVFTPCMLLACVDVARRLSGGHLPPWIGAVTLTVLLAQPYLTVRLAGRLRRVPVWLDRTVLLIFVGTAVPLMFMKRPLDGDDWALAIAGFVMAELVGAGLLLGKARGRTGTNRARLMTAAWASVAFAGTFVVLGVGALLGGDPVFSAASRVLALVSGIGYLVAFLPPRWLRRAFSATAAQSVTERLLRAPVESPEQVWQIYAEIMRKQSGADAVAVLMPRADDLLTPIAYAGPPIPSPDALVTDRLTEVIRAGQTARLRDGHPGLVAHYGDLGDDFVSVLSMPVPPDIEGAVLLFNRHRTLFSDDDLRLLAALGGHAAILAERQAVTAAQRRLAADLSASVEALTAASQAKSTFLANMSHELRTPLNAIIGFSDLMRLEEPDGDRRRVPAEWIDHIHTSGRHLLGLINDILDLAKIEAGRLDLRVAPLRLDTAVTELMTGLAPLLSTKRLSVTADLAEATALADRVRFRQIVENLLSNAIKFTPEGGKLTVTIAEADEHVYVTVADTGVGIAPDDQTRVFEEFQQVGDPDRQRAGTGLGLALTKRLVEAHNGEISVVSVPGVGSSFTVRLPAAPFVPPTPEPIPHSGRPHSARILLIEDDPGSAELMRTQLATAGYHVEVAGTGEEGLTSAGANPPDAIVLDVTLPGIDGWEVIRRLKAAPRLAGIPVFFASILDERSAGLALGADDYFVKPVDPATLLAALARSVASRPTPRVLVVDQDEAVRLAIAQGLRVGGADVVACADGKDGLRLSREQAFDLIVCDMRSPDVDGFGLLAAIEQDPATRHTPVLGLSAVTAFSPGVTSPTSEPPMVATAMAGGVVARALGASGSSPLRNSSSGHSSAGHSSPSKDDS